MKRNGDAKRLGTAFAKALSAALMAGLCAGLLLFAGCKDLFHQEEPKDVYYTVTFNADGGSFSGGSTTQTRTVASGGQVRDMPSEPSRSGYAFGGWYTASNGGGSQFTSSTAVYSDTTVCAYWMAQYTVTFNADGGTPATQTVSATSGGSVGSSNMTSDPSKSGYTFGGWYTSTGGGGSQFTSSTTVTANITVYAKWTANAAAQYTVTFDADGGTPATQAKTIASGGSAGFSNMPSDPSKSGYTFGGWYTSTGGGGSQFTSSTAVSANITVYAKWTAVAQYTVTFDADGGTPATQTASVPSGGSVESSSMPSDPSKSGYTFDGWWTERDGGGSQFTPSTTVSANITVYAKWTAQYTATFDADGGTPATQTASATSGGSVESSNMPSEPTKSGYTFDGWWTERNGGGSQFTSSTAVSANITVYAKWTAASLPSNLSLAESLTWISGNALDGGAYTITASANETIAPKTLSYSGKNVSVTLNGGTAERTIILSSNGSLFTVGSGVTLTLDNNVTLQGRSANTNALIRVNSGGTLVMESGSKITGNSNSSDIGGGVYVYSNGMFTMSGGEISGNTSIYSGGGVYVYSNGMFTMSGGEVNGNTSSAFGGGVYVYRGAFTMSGGAINNNTANGGGGVGIDSSVMFTMSSGEISGNTATHGGGVLVFNSGTFTMSGGTISGNTASSTYGGGVAVSSSSGKFTKQTGGVIYGSNASSTLKNTAADDSYGHAVFVNINSSPQKKRNSTAGSGVTLDSSLSGAEGGWE